MPSPRYRLAPIYSSLSGSSRVQEETGPVAAGTVGVPKPIIIIQALFQNLHSRHYLNSLFNNRVRLVNNNGSFFLSNYEISNKIVDETKRMRILIRLLVKCLLKLTGQVS
jgi:hypothetical protein